MWENLECKATKIGASSLTAFFKTTPWDSVQAASFTLNYCTCRLLMPTLLRLQLDKLPEKAGPGLTNTHEKLLGHSFGFADSEF